MLLKDALPVWFKLLAPGGILVLSFNSYTLKKEDFQSYLVASGYEVLKDGPWEDFEHWVEQAVNRDLVIAKKDAF